jgi:hypothetical protein
MNFKSILSALLAVLLIAALFAGCASEPAATEAPKTEAPATEAPKTEAPATTEAPEAKYYVEVNGQKIVLGVPFEELKALLPEETAPAETIGSCDEDSDWKQTTHTYDGFTVTEDKDGIANGITVNKGNYTVNGLIGIGASKEDVKAAFGEPDTDAEWGLYYEKTSPMMNFYLDEETDTVCSFAVMLSFIM